MLVESVGLGRFDLVIPTFVVEKLNILQKIEPILQLLRSIMGPRTPHIRTHNIMFAPVGSEAQTWHYDDSVRRSNVYRYFTILVPLNPIDDDCGGTEIWSDTLKRSDMVRPQSASIFMSLSFVIY